MTTEYSDRDKIAANYKNRMSKWYLVIIYFVIWTVSVAAFWLVGRIYALSYVIIVFCFVLPLTTVIISAFIGKGAEWRDIRWIMLLFLGFMYMMAYKTTFTLAGMTILDKFSLDFMLPGILLSGLGMCIGTVIRIILGKRAGQSKGEKSETK